MTGGHPCSATKSMIASAKKLNLSEGDNTLPAVDGDEKNGATLCFSSWGVHKVRKRSAGHRSQHMARTDRRRCHLLTAYAALATCSQKSAAGLFKSFTMSNSGTFESINLRGKPSRGNLFLASLAAGTGCVPVNLTQTEAHLTLHSLDLRLTNSLLTGKITGNFITPLTADSGINENS